MAKGNKAVNKFRPERPIYLSVQNTQFKTQDEVDFAIEKLRKEGWLVTRLPEGGRVRPLHMSFNSENDYEEFKEDCQVLEINLKAPVLNTDDLEEMIANDSKGAPIPGADATNTYDDPDGNRHVESGA